MHENKCAWSKVEVMDRVRMMFLKLTGRGEAAGDDAVVDGGEVGWAFLKLASAGDEEIFSRKWLGKVGYKESCHHEVEGENWLNPVHHVIQRKAG